MKLTTLLLIVVCLHVSAAGFSQRVNIAGKDLSLEKVFSLIKKQTGYVFFYDYSIFEGASKVSLDIKDADVTAAMQACLKDQSLEFSILNKTITIVRKEEKNTPVPVSDNAGPGKTIKVTGIVYNEAGIPLSGANVTIKATGKGTITNAKGEFELPAIPDNSVLLVSYIGYAQQSVKVTDGKSMQVYLLVAKNELDKVVVQAYGTTTQRLATGNIATVTAAEIERQPVMNPLEALMGKVPGMLVTLNNGYASAPINVEIRGRANINGLPSDPLIIIDGVPTSLNGTGNGGTTGIISPLANGNIIMGPAQGQSPLFSVNPLDIESVTVLKDADATAIYGSRGANGVVLITTKKGKAGKAKFDLNVYQGMSVITQHYQMLNEQQYLSMRHEALRNDKIAADPGVDYDLLVWDTTQSVDWQKAFWGGTGKTTDVEASYSGGDKTTTFRLSGDYHRSTSILNYSGADQRGSMQFNLGRRSLDQRLQFSFTGMYAYTQSDLINGPSMVTMAPDAPSVFDAHGKLNYAGWTPISYQYPFANILQPYTAKTGYLNSQLEGKYEIIKGLNFSTNLGYSTTHMTQLSLQPLTSMDPSTNPKANASFGINDFVRLIVEPQLEYKGVLGKGKINGLIGGTYQATNFNGEDAFGTGYVNDNLLHSIANAASKNVFDGYSQYRYVAAFSRLNYNWDDKYILNLSARRDGSSRFGPGKQFGNFGAVGAAWIFTQENWLKDNLSFLSFGKLRGSYGLTGSDVIADYQYLSRWSAGNTLPYAGNASYVALQHVNPNLHWQTNRKLEVALGLGFLKDRFTTEIAWYRNLCGDQLLSYLLPIMTGFSNVTANFPATVQNTGIEIKLDAKLIQKKDLEWSVNMSVGANRNILKSFPGIAQTSYASLYTVGKPLNITKILHYTGVDPQTGQYTFQDKNKDGQIDYSWDATTDLYDKDLTTRYDGGFGTDLRYKGWQLNLFFNFRRQESPSAVFNGMPGQVNYNQSTQVLNHWQKPGDIAKFARYTTNPQLSDALFYLSDAVYSDGSYVRLRNVSLSYELPGDWIRKAGMQSCKIYFRAQNLFVITKYNGVDPDVTTFGGMPPEKVMTAGMQFNF